jgi:hypothetical protein
VQWASRSSRRVSTGWLIGAIGARATAPAGRLRVGTRMWRRPHSQAHDVSITPGIGRHFASRWRAKTPIIIMRRLQQGRVRSEAVQVERDVFVTYQVAHGGALAEALAKLLGLLPAEPAVACWSWAPQPAVG